MAELVAFDSLDLAFDSQSLINLIKPVVIAKSQYLFIYGGIPFSDNQVK